MQVKDVPLIKCSMQSKREKEEQTTRYHKGWTVDKRVAGRDFPGYPGIRRYSKR